MGFGFPASIGAKAARPDVYVVDVAGDRSFNMTENSLAVSGVREFTGNSILVKQMICWVWLHSGKELFMIDAIWGYC